MITVNREQILGFRLRAHHLDRWYKKEALLTAAGACGFQNTPPGAWKLSALQRIADGTPEELDTVLEQDKTLLQAWSIRGIPLVFPTEQSSVFLEALIPDGKEEWIYTKGIAHALNHLGKSFPELLGQMEQAIRCLDEMEVAGKAGLDAEAAARIRMNLSQKEQTRWDAPSVYGAGQTMGQAAVSFLLRPCAFKGFVVFGKRNRTVPTFTSYQRWLGFPMQTAGRKARQELARKYLHCFGPTSPGLFEEWMGSSLEQAKRLWSGIQEELEPVSVEGKLRYLLKKDCPALLSSAAPERRYHLLSAHDPYLDQKDKEWLLPDPKKQKEVWKMQGNPGAVLRDGQIIGLWRGRQTGSRFDVTAQLWEGADQSNQDAYLECAQRIAAMKGKALGSFTINE